MSVRSFFVFLSMFLITSNLPIFNLQADEQSISVETSNDEQLEAPKIKKKHLRRRLQERRKAERLAGKHKKKTFSSMEYEELKERKNELKNAGYLDLAAKYIEKMTRICSDVQELGLLMLELGDIFFALERYDKAMVIYKEFTRLYPGSDELEYAYYRAIVCCFKEILDAERDQTNTREAIMLSLQFLERAAIFTKYTDEVIKILNASRQRLLESELSIVAFYIKRGMYISANTRLANIEKDFLTNMPTIKPQLLEIECTIAQLQGDVKRLEQKRIELAALAPEKIPAQPATKVAKRKSNKDRF